MPKGQLSPRVPDDSGQLDGVARPSRPHLLDFLNPGGDFGGLSGHHWLAVLFQRANLSEARLVASRPATVCGTRPGGASAKIDSSGFDSHFAPWHSLNS